MEPVPEGIPKALSYWHKSFTREPGTYNTVVTGETVRLYNISTTPMLHQGTVVERQTLISLPGFAHRIRTKLTEMGFIVDLVDERTPFPEPDMVAACKGLRDYQYEVAHVALHSRGGVISAPTGYGKTNLIGALIRGYDRDALKARGTPMALVVTPTLDISRKNYEDLQEILTEREVGLVNSTSKRFSDDVQVVTPESLDHITLSEVGLLIYDEVHTLGLRRMQRLLEATRAVRYGMSATPSGRFDGGDLVIEGLFGPVVCSVSYADAVAVGAVVPIKVYWLEAPRPDRDAGWSTKNGLYRHAIWRNRALHVMVASAISRIPEDVQVLCVVDKLEHMSYLQPYLPEFTMVHAESNKRTLGKGRYVNLEAITKAERKRIYAGVADGSTTRVLSTGVYRQGVNFPNLQVLVNCEGMGSRIIAGQLPGRTSRVKEGKEMGYILDFWHSWDMVEKHGRQSPGMLLKDDRSREQVYTSLGFEQEWINDISRLSFG